MSAYIIKDVCGTRFLKILTMIPRTYQGDNILGQQNAVSKTPGAIFPLNLQVSLAMILDPEGQKACIKNQTAQLPLPMVTQHSPSLSDPQERKKKTCL
jgi:hypothetical protein